jgi:formylglycine-generating enzyme required for sulfatase activity
MYLAGKTSSGAFDMSGNVWEWQSNRYEKSSEWLALRGGSWYNHPDYARVSARDLIHPYYQWYNLGFRVVALPS